MKAPDSSPPLVTIFLVSFASLAYEVLLVRLFSIIHWHHFAFMVISIALLGYGASGSLITLFQRRLLQHFNYLVIANAALFGLSSVLCFVIVQQLPFNTLEILWDSSQWSRLLLTYLLLALPFFFVANTIALTMARYRQSIPLVYGVDLIGAGLGALSLVYLLQWLEPVSVLRALATCGFAAGLFALRLLPPRRRLPAGLPVVLIAAGILTAPSSWTEPHLSEFKGLEQMLLVEGTREIAHYSDSISRIDVVESEQVPVRHAPGLSLMSPATTPEQLVVFRDGDEMFAIDRFAGEDGLRYLDYISTALPFHVHPDPESVLVLGASTGSELNQAWLHGAERIVAVEPDRKLAELLTTDYADYFDWSRLRDRVEIEAVSSRGYAAATDNRFDLVMNGMPGGSAGGAAGVHELSTTYTWTVEALQSWLGLLDDDGLLSITMWTGSPPRDNLRLFATTVEALQRNDVQQPGEHLAWIRSWNTATLLIGRNALTQPQIEAVRSFSEARAFDIAWLPGIEQSGINRYNVLQQPVYHLAARALLSDTADAFIDQYKFDIQPVTDNRPYFYNTFKWSSLTELLNLADHGGIAMIGVGYPTLIVTLLQALLAAIVLILLPLFARGNRAAAASSERGRIVLYFTAIGLAFLFIEIAFIQQFTLILSQPLYAVAAALCAFLVFSGLGSLYVQRRLHTAPVGAIHSVLRIPIVLIAVLTLCYLVALPLFGVHIMALPEALRILAAVALAAPLAFAMGMPFPLGLTAVGRSTAALLPWAWGINGCASVLSAILAIVLAIEIGFSGVMLCAVVLYGIAWLARPMKDEQSANERQ